MRHKSLLMIFMLVTVISFMLVMTTMSLAQSSFTAQMAGQKVAVVVYALTTSSEPFKKNALSRLEGILNDNDITVLDNKKAENLKDVFKTLNDPGAFVTAEMFVENATKYDIKGLAAIYLSVDIATGIADYYSATAHADIRFISEEDAKVHASSTIPMGVPGRPPSDGLTKNSASLNAVQRAIDDACEKLGLEIMDPATPRSVRLTLEGPVALPVVASVQRTPSRNNSLSRFALLENKRWRVEEVTCTARAPAGTLAAVAGYIIDTDFRRRPQRLYGSRIHLIDLRTNQELMSFYCHTVEKKKRGEKGTRKILDCMFILNWRYLLAITGNKLFLWDTERGQLQSSIRMKSSLKSAILGLYQNANGSFIIVNPGKKQIAYRIIRKK